MPIVGDVTRALAVGLVALSAVGFLVGLAGVALAADPSPFLLLSVAALTCGFGLAYFLFAGEDIKPLPSKTVHAARASAAVNSGPHTERLLTRSDS